MTVKTLILTGAALLSVLAMPAYATEATPPHTMAAAPEKTGNVDVDFVQAMIAHHKDALTMSEEYLKTGKDKWTLRMAQQIIHSQEGEIKAFEAWLKKNGVKTAE